METNHVQSVQSDVVYHDDSVTAFVGSGQWKNNHGNTIIVPNEHFENIYDLPLSYAQDIHRVAKMLALTMKAVYACEGVSTRQHNEPAGSQDVWHYHLHVTPRYIDDNYYATQRERMSISERAKHAEKIRKHLAIIRLQD
ncbi:MAG: HIT domain-containing protein [Anaerolineae bacterium]|nr:HIT domain-containing protein [Anaerolineae bacterium]